MSKIAVILTNMFEDVEYTKPVEAFKKSGHQITNVGIKAGEEVTGKHAETKVKIEKSVKDVSVSDFDALFIPGGYSPDQLRMDDNAVKFAGDFVKSGKPVFALCHAAQLLINAQVLKGRKVTGWKSIAQDIRNAGAEYPDQAVVKDGNLISSRGPDDIPQFVDASLKELRA